MRYLVRGIPVSVLALVGLNSAVEAVLLGGDMGLVGSPDLRQIAYALGAFWTPLMHGTQPLFTGQRFSMFVTYAFLHGGWLHLVVNMFALYSLGKIIVLRIGQKRFLGAYAVCVLGGALGFGLLSVSQNPMVGASGALFGLMGIWICWDYMDRRHYGDPLWVTGRALMFLIGYNIVFWIALSGQLAWETHLGGFVAGWLLALHWGRDVHLQSRRRRMSVSAQRRGDL